MPDSHTIITVVVLFTGTMVFLRLVGKEKHRREKHLQLRVIEKVNELKREEERKAGEPAGDQAQPAGKAEVLMVLPVGVAES
jgi:hypothetical protein